MTYEIEFGSKAKKFIKNLEKKIAIRILDKFESIRENPFAYLKHLEGKGYKLRIGNFRAILDIDSTKKVLFVRVINKRSQVYKTK